jgi:hypothetical protein
VHRNMEAMSELPLGAMYMHMPRMTEGSELRLRQLSGCSSRPACNDSPNSY